MNNNIYIFHSKPDELKSRLTVVGVYNTETNEVVVASSMCNTKYDSYNKKLGTKIALGRATKPRLVHLNDEGKIVEKDSADYARSYQNYEMKIQIAPGETFDNDYFIRVAKQILHNKQSYEKYTENIEDVDKQTVLEAKAYLGEGSSH